MPNPSGDLVMPNLPMPFSDEEMREIREMMQRGRRRREARLWTADLINQVVELNPPAFVGTDVWAVAKVEVVTPVRTTIAELREEMEKLEQDMEHTRISEGVYVDRSDALKDEYKKLVECPECLEGRDVFRPWLVEVDSLLLRPEHRIPRSHGPFRIPEDDFLENVD